MPKPGLTLLAALTLGGSIAKASPPDVAPSAPDRGVESVEMGGSARGVAQDWLILPKGLELSGELRFLTADPSLGGNRIQFSDVGLLTLRVRSALGGKAELVASVDLLPKQPSYTDELIWQGGSLGVRTQIPRHAVAVGLRAAGGPMLGELGYWGGGSLGVEARKRLEKIMAFSGGISGVGTYLAPQHGRRAWVAEIAGGGAVQFRDPWGTVGGWLGVGYAVPIAHAGNDPMSGAELDPQPRLDLHLGGVVSLVDEWDVSVDFAVIDRGEMQDMATRLPILDGGFDQKQVMLGVSYHPKDDPGRDYVLTQY